MNPIIKYTMKPAFRFLIMLLMFASIVKLSAQQNVLFNTYLYDMMQLNIAFAGSECSEANLNYRNQWLGLKEAPKLYQLNAHTPLSRSTGAGIRFVSQQSGLLNGIQGTVGYGYRIKVNSKTKVLFGIGVGFIQNTLNAQKATVIDANDETLKEAGKQNATGFDSELGVQFLSDKLKCGFSVLHLYSTNSSFVGSSYKTLPQMNITASYLFKLNKHMDLEPMLVDRLTVKGDNAAEGFVNVHYDKMFTLGAGYRHHYGLLVFAGAKVDKFRIAYSFDYGASKNRTLTGSSHQVLLGFYLCKKRNDEIPSKSKKIMKTQF